MGSELLAWYGPGTIRGFQKNQQLAINLDSQGSALLASVRRSVRGTWQSIGRLSSVDYTFNEHLRRYGTVAYI